MELKHPLNSVGAESLSLSLSRSINIRRNFNVNHYGSVNRETKSNFKYTRFRLTLNDILNELSCSIILKRGRIKYGLRIVHVYFEAHTLGNLMTAFEHHAKFVHRFRHDHESVAKRRWVMYSPWVLMPSPFPFQKREGVFHSVSIYLRA